MISLFASIFLTRIPIASLVSPCFAQNCWAVISGSSSSQMWSTSQAPSPRSIVITRRSSRDAVWRLSLFVVSVGFFSVVWFFWDDSWMIVPVALNCYCGCRSEMFFVEELAAAVAWSYSRRSWIRKACCYFSRSRIYWLMGLRWEAPVD